MAALLQTFGARASDEWILGSSSEDDEMSDCAGGGSAPDSERTKL